MKRIDFLERGLAEGHYCFRSWLYSLLTISNDSKPITEETKLYTVKRDQSGVYCIVRDPEGNMVYERIDDAKYDEPLWAFQDKITPKKSYCLNVDDNPKETRLGNLLFNMVVLVHTVKDKIPFVYGRVVANHIEGSILKKLKDTPKADVPRDHESIYVDEYLNIGKMMSFYECLCLIGSVSMTRKAITPAPGIIPYRNKLVEAAKSNGEDITDGAVLVRINEALDAYDAAYLKGDGCEHFLKGKKTKTARSKLFCSVGAEPGMDEKAKLDPMYRSYTEGWQRENFVQLVNSGIAGSYARGKQTQLGGVSYKYIQQATQSVYIRPGSDCGSTIGIPRLYNSATVNKLIGSHILVNGKSTLVKDAAMAAQLTDKVVTRRTPLTCHSPGTEYCAKCFSIKMGLKPYGMTLEAGNLGSQMLNVFMQKTHGTRQTVVEIDFKTAIS